MEGSPSPLTHLAMLGFVPASLILFLVLPRRRALFLTIIGGYLFLPMFTYDLPGLPNVGKAMLPGFAGILGVVIFDPHLLLRFSPRRCDLPMALWCLCPLLTATNLDDPLYAGLSGVVRHVLVWGLPYLLGRLYLRDLSDLAELSRAFVAGGFLYMFFCFWELRMSPNLHHMLYGFHQHQFSQTIKAGGWRPMVFLQHGLAVGMFMAMCALMAVWLWRFKSMRALWGIPMVYIAPPLLLTAILCKSFLSIVLLLLGMGLMWSSRVLYTRLFVGGLVLLPFLYMMARTNWGWSASELIEAAGFLNETAAKSIETRMRSENLLYEHAMQNPMFGRGTDARMLVLDDTGRMLAIPDGLWILTMSALGIVGLCALVGTILLGPTLLIVKVPVALWSHPRVAPAVLLALVLALWMVDNLLNAMVNTVFVLALGGVTGFASRPDVSARLREAAEETARAGKESGPLVRTGRA